MADSGSRLRNEVTRRECERMRTMTDLPMTGPVHCVDSACGTMTDVILNPVTHKVTHLALRDDKLPDNPTRLVPVGHVASATKDDIRLSCTWSDVAAMQPFVVSHLVQQSPSPSVDAYSYSSQYVFNDTAYESVSEREVPEGALAVVSGMAVEASNGKVGTLDALVLDESSGEITHLQMHKGHLWGEKEVTIPIADVDSVLGNTVYLKLDKKTVKELPTVKVKHP